MGKYDIFAVCPICGMPAEFINGKSNLNVVLIKTKRKSTLLFHRKCVENEQKERTK